MATEPWRVRAIQLDLARQRETLDTIEHFAAFAAANGFNCLHLYLEGVVRTETFPDPPPDESYSLDELRRMGDAARAAGLTVVPCVNTLGHAELFLRHPRLAHLEGKANWGGPMFDPHNPATYAFLERYMGEIAEALRCDQFNVGCDEAWRLGRTPGCLTKRQAGATYADLLLEHLNTMHAICERLGQRMWIWSDLLEYLSDAEIARIPRDIIMCSWHYTAEQIDMDGVQGHFDGLKRRDLLALYDRVGFDVLVCPIGGAQTATEKLTHYARRYDVAGAIYTLWELRACCLPAFLPDIATVGRWWADPRRRLDEVWGEVCRDLLPGLSPAAYAALRCGAAPHRLPGEPFLFPPTPEEIAARRTAELQLAVLDDDAPASEQAEEIVDELRSHLRQSIAGAALNEALCRMVHPDDTYAVPGRDTIEDWCGELEALADARAAQWARHRAGILPCRADAGLRAAANAARALADGRHDALLVLSLFLWEGYSMPALRVEARFGVEWRQIFEGTCKPPRLELSHYTAWLPLTLGGALPERIRLTVSGFGGQGVRYLSITNGMTTRRPVSVVHADGRVADAQNVLTDDARVCFLGDPDTVATLMEQRETAAASITLSLGEVTEEP